MVLKDGALLHLRCPRLGRETACGGVGQGCSSVCPGITGHVSWNRPSGSLSGLFSQITEGSVCTPAPFRSPPVADLTGNSSLGFSSPLVDGSRAAEIKALYVC